MMSGNSYCNYFKLSFLPFITQNNQFSHNVPIGAYVLRVNDSNFNYDPLLVEVYANEVKSFQYNIKTGKGLKYKYPIDLKPQGKKKYFEVRQTSIK